MLYNHTMLFSGNGLDFLAVMRTQSATQDKITTKKSPFCRTLYPSVMLSNLVRSAADMSSVVSGFEFAGAGLLPTSPMPGWNSALPYSGSAKRDRYQRVHQDGAESRQGNTLKLHVDTFFWYWQLPALRDCNRSGWFVSWLLWDVLNLFHDIIAFENLSEYYMLTIKVTDYMSIERKEVGYESLTLGQRL